MRFVWVKSERDLLKIEKRIVTSNSFSSGEHLKHISSFEMTAEKTLLEMVNKISCKFI